MKIFEKGKIVFAPDENLSGEFYFTPEIFLDEALRNEYSLDFLLLLRQWQKKKKKKTVK